MMLRNDLYAIQFVSPEGDNILATSLVDGDQSVKLVIYRYDPNPENCAIVTFNFSRADILAIKALSDRDGKPAVRGKVVPRPPLIVEED